MAEASGAEQSDESVRPFRIGISDEAIGDLKRRLANIRWPHKETADGWVQGVPLHKAREVADYWLNHYDWRRFEARANSHPQYITRIDNPDVHFFHVPSKHSDAIPVLLMHGWPGSIVEFIRLIEPLVDPEAYGGRAEDAFHVVLPSLPGWGFTEPPREQGWTHARTARMCAALMVRLGYGKWVAQGGDYGAHVLSDLAEHPPEGLAAIHLNLLFAIPRELGEHATEEEREAFEAFRWTQLEEGGFSRFQKTRPQTLGYSLTDSPIGQAMWIYEKFHRWTDNTGNPEDAIGIDDMLDNISLHLVHPKRRPVRSRILGSAELNFWWCAHQIAGGSHCIQKRYLQISPLMGGTTLSEFDLLERAGERRALWHA